MERKKRCIRSLSKKDTKEEDDTGVHIDDLPEEMFLKILGYLKYDELSRAGRVCKKWYALTRCPFLWTRVDAYFTRETISMSEKVMKFVGVLPAYVSHLKVNLELTRKGFSDLRRIVFADLAVKVQEKCPNLKVMIFHSIVLTDFGPSSGLKGLLSNLRALVFHRCFLMNAVLATYTMNLKLIAKVYKPAFRRDKLITYKCISKFKNLENLCLARSRGFDLIFSYYPSIVSRLKVLDLEGASICSESFAVLWNYGHQLVELYICFTAVSDDELDFTKSSSITAGCHDSDDELNFKESSSVSDDKLDFTKVLPCLKTVCLRYTHVTCRGVISLLKSCETLQCIYVGDRLNDNSYDYEKCNSKKVQVVHGIQYCNHYTNKRYMCL